MSIPDVPAGKDVQVFFDGECPLCMREIRMLRRRDRTERIAFTDIAATGFDASSYGKTHASMMGSIHGRDSEGNWLTGVEVFRQLYAAIGFERTVRMSRLPLVRHALEAGYSIFSRNRLALTGRTACGPERCEGPVVEARA